MLKSAHVVFALSLLLLAHEAGAAPHGSFSHGFSSHASSSHASSSHVSTPHASPAPARTPSGGFGSFSSRQAAAPGAPAHTPKSDSALSQQLSRNAAQARAVQTLDQRDASKAARDAPQPAPSYAQQAPAQPINVPPPAPTTVIVNNHDSGGLGHVVAGAMIARSMNAHAHGGAYPAPGYNGPAGATPQGSSGGASFFGVVLTLCLLALIAWGLWFAWRGLRRRRAALREASKPNYAFERN